MTTQETRRAYGVPIRVESEDGGSSDQFALVRSVAVTAPIEALDADGRHRSQSYFSWIPNGICACGQGVERGAHADERRQLAGCCPTASIRSPTTFGGRLPRRSGGAVGRVGGRVFSTTDRRHRVAARSSGRRRQRMKRSWTRRRRAKRCDRWSGSHRRQPRPRSTSGPGWMNGPSSLTSTLHHSLYRRVAGSSSRPH